MYGCMFEIFILDECQSANNSLSEMDFCLLDLNLDYHLKIVRVSMPQTKIYWYSSGWLGHMALPPLLAIVVQLYIYPYDQLKNYKI